MSSFNYSTKRYTHQASEAYGELSTYFAWSTPDGRKVGRQRGLKNPRALRYGRRNADFMSYSRHNKGGSGRNKGLHTFESVTAVWSDLDPDLPLSWQEIIAECKEYNVPKPNQIIKTPTPGHHQVIWHIPELNKSKLGWWQKVQKGIFALLKKHGADPLSVEDPTKYLRNPDSKQVEVVYSSDHKVTLSDLYYALKAAGLIPSKTKGKPRREKQVSFSSSLRKLRHYFKAKFRENPQLITSHNAIYTELKIPRSSYFLLLNTLIREKEINTQRIRAGKTWRTIFDSPRKDSKHPPVLQYRILKLLSVANRQGIPFKFRDIGFFILGLGLKKCGYSFFHAVDSLQGAFALSESNGSHRFTRDEFLKCLRSAYKERYKFFYSFNNPTFQQFLAALGNVNLDCQNEHSEACDCLSCVPVSSLDFGFPGCGSVIAKDVKTDSPEMEHRLDSELLKNVVPVRPVFDGVQGDREPRADEDPLLKTLRVMNERRFGREFYPDQVVCSSNLVSGDPLLDDIHKRNLERFGPDFYTKP